VTTVAAGLPLPPVQRGALEAGDGGHAGRWTYALTGELDRAALDEAWQRTIEANPVLRAAIEWRPPDPPRQLERAVPAGSPEYHDFGDLPPAERGPAFGLLFADELRRAFDLDRPPLARVVAVSETGWLHRIFVVAHRAALDEWSLDELAVELLARYAARRGEVPARPALREYLQRLDGRPLGDAEAFWRGQLTGDSDRRAPAAVTAVAALARRPLPVDPAVAGAGVPAVADDSAVARVPAVAGAVLAGLPVAGVVVAAWALVHSRLAGSPEVTVDLQLTGRAHDPLAARVLGPLEHTVPLRIHVDEGLPVPTYLRAVHEAIGAAGRHEWAPAPRDVGAAPQAIALRPAPAPLPAGLALARHPAPAAAGRPFTLDVEAAGGVEARYQPANVDEREVGARLDQLARVLAGLASAGDGRLRDVPMLGADERHRILVDWNATRRDYPRGELMHEWFERQASRRPDAIAVARGDQVVSYRGLDARANRWAERLRGAGAGPEVTVGVHLERTPELVAVLLGVLKAGAAYVPLDPGYPRDRLEFMVEDSGMAVLVTDRPGLTIRHPVAVMQPDAVMQPNGRMPQPPRREPRPAAPPGSTTPADTAPAGTAPGNTAYVLYTSGSTGRPKGVMLSHDNAVDLLHWSMETFGASLDRVLATTSICFDCSILEIFAPLSWGGVAVLADSALDVAALDVGHDLRLLHSVPSVMAELVRLGRLPETVTDVLLGGEPPWARLVDDVYDSGRVERLLNLYGPTEYTSYATMAVIGRGRDGAPPIGRPVANARVHLLDRYGNPVPVDAPGELFLAGRGLARGYLGRPSLTAQRFVPDTFADVPGERAYRTGDLASYDDAGVLTYLGRTDDQVKVRGVRVEPGEVERALLRHPAVGEVAVVAPTDGEARRRLVAFVVAAGPTPPAAEQLREHLSGLLPAALVPDSYELVDKLPRMPNGKIDRGRLVPPAAATCAATPFVTPRDELEAKLAALWAEAFDVPRVGIYDDFYTLGGHSLAAMRIRRRIADTLAVDPPMKLIFSCRTVASLATALRPLLAGPPPPAVPRGRLRRGDTAPLSPNQRAIVARAERHPDDPTLHLPLCVRLAGPLRPAALAAALTALVRRHEILRSALTAGGRGELVQAVAPPAVIELPLVDLSGLPAAAREGVATELSVAAARRPFDLGRWPILHAMLFRLDEHDHVLSVTLHQLAGDVWSMAAVGRQLLELYGVAIEASRPPADLPRVQYPDWAQWQVGWLGSAAGTAQREFWRGRLAGLPALSLPAAATGQAAATGAAAGRGPSAAATSTSHDFGLDGELLGRAGALGGQESATLYLVLLAAYQLLLGRWSGQSRFAVGCPVTGRVHPDLAWTIGPFLNAIVIRADLTGDPSFRDLLRRTRNDGWDAYANQDLPFAQLVLDLDGDRDPTRHPVFQASIVLHYLDQPIAAPGGLEVTDFGRRPPPHTALDLELAVYAGAGAAACAMTYRKDVLDAATVEWFAQRYVALLRAVVTDPDRPLSAYPLDAPG